MNSVLVSGPFITLIGSCRVDVYHTTNFPYTKVFLLTDFNFHYEESINRMV